MESIHCKPSLAEELQLDYTADMAAAQISEVHNYIVEPLVVYTEYFAALVGPHTEDLTA